MNKIIHYLKENKVFLLFLFVFSWVLILKNAIGRATSWNDFVFHSDAPFWIFIHAILIFLFIGFIKNKADKNSGRSTFSIKKYLRFFAIGLFSYLVVANLLGITIANIFDTFPRNYGSSHMITYRLFNQIIDFTIFGSFSLALLYFRENKNYKEQLSRYEISNAKSKIQQLKTQLNPHFLFNNLNILDQLIEEDKEKASEFLGQFSELYRYAIRNADKELISIQEELAFAQNYFELMEKKYEGYYQFVVDDSVKLSLCIVPPFCLQVLIENAIVHNLGTRETPVIITITMENGLKVINNRVEQVRKKKGNGVALNNLSEQFQLLTNSSVHIEETEHTYAVTLPLLKMNSHD